MSKDNPHSTARADGSCDDCGSFHGHIPNATEQARRRWQFCVTPQIEALARSDSHLHALLYIWDHEPGLSFSFVAVEYLKRGDDLAKLVLEMGCDVKLWRACWPKWPEETGRAHRPELEDVHLAKCIIVEAATWATILLGQHATWRALQPPPPIVVTREQAEAMGLLIPRSPGGGGESGASGCGGAARRSARKRRS